MHKQHNASSSIQNEPFVDSRLVKAYKRQVLFISNKNTEIAFTSQHSHPHLPRPGLHSVMLNE